MEFVGEPTRISMPYDVESEWALVRIGLMRHGVPARVLDNQSSAVSA